MVEGPARIVLGRGRLRATVENVVELLVELRARYDEFVASATSGSAAGTRSAECGTSTPRAAHLMDDLRERILHEFGSRRGGCRACAAGSALAVGRPW